MPSSRAQAHAELIVTIITLSRLVYRKGIDLLVASAPTICDLFPEVRFVVGGDGPKMVELEQMREKYRLQDRIELLGGIKPSDVQTVSSCLLLFCPNTCHVPISCMN
jgi:glycosyltransferase involved in cell wall biosynthesis